MSRIYKPISDLGDIITGKTPPTANNELWDGAVPFITPTDIKGFDSFYQGETERTVSQLGVSKQRKTLIPKNSVCVSCIATIGKICLTKCPSITNQQINSIIPNEYNDYRYILYMLRYNLPYIQLVGGGSGSGTPIISKNKFAKFKFLVEDDLSAQRRIASVLSAYDNLIENNNRRISLLEQMAENLYKEWFVRFRFPGHENAELENNLPKGWKYAKLEDILSLKDSVRIPLSSMERSIMQKKYPYYGAASILDYVNDYLFDGIYLLLGEDGSVIDENGYPYIQYVWGKFWVNNHAHVIEKNGVYSVEFLYCMFKKMNIQSVVTGVAQPKISQGRLFNKKVILPCDTIISLFDKQIQPIFAEIRKLSEQNQLLSRQRDLLLPRLMSGKLEVNA